MHRAAVSDFGRHHLGLTRWYRPKRWTWRAESSGSCCGRRAPPRGCLNDCCWLAETRREWQDGGAWRLCGRSVNDKASLIFPSTASILCLDSLAHIDRVVLWYSRQAKDNRELRAQFWTSKTYEAIASQGTRYCPRYKRLRSCSSYHCDYENWTYQRRYAHSGDARR